MLFYGVVSDSTEEAVELVTSREEVEAIAAEMDRDDPDQAGILRVDHSVVSRLIGRSTSTSK